MRLFIARFRRVEDGSTREFPLPPATPSLEQAWALARQAAAEADFPVEVVDVFPVTAHVIGVELPPVPDDSDLYWPSIPDGMVRAAAMLLFLFLLSTRD